MRKYVIAMSDAADDERRGFSKDGGNAILTSSFIVGIIDTGVFVDGTVESTSDIYEMLECLFCAGEELVGKVYPSCVNKSGVFSLLCLAHAEHIMRSMVARGDKSVGADMIVLYDGLRRLLDETDIEGYVDRCISEIDEDGE